jgi:hypothetical protein
MEAEGISSRRTVERLKRLFPEEAIPSNVAVANWRRELHMSLHEELEDSELAIARRADELVTQKLDYCEENIDKARLGELTLTAGIYRDKGFKRQDIKVKAKQTEAGQALADAINRMADLSIPQLEDIIEGEVV